MKNKISSLLLSRRRQDKRGTEFETLHDDHVAGSRFSLTLCAKRSFMTGKIFAAEITFQDTPPLIRERFTDSEKNIKRILGAFRRRVKEVFVFANRQRLTVYIAHEDMKPLFHFFHGEQRLKGYVQYYYNSAESMTHLMATATGLLSPVKGERKVLSEMARCYRWACAADCIGMTLDQAFRRATETAKRIRISTGIDQYCASIVETGIELLYDRLRDIHSMNFVVLGTGELAKVALDSLTEEGIVNITLAGRDSQTVANLAKAYGIHSTDYESLPEYFAEADVVIGAATDEFEIQLIPTLKESDLAEKGNRIILDLGIPPNFGPDALGILAEEFYNVDDLRRLHPSPLECFGGVEVAWRQVLRASDEFSFQLQLLHQSPVLRAYLAREFAARNAEAKVRAKRGIRGILSFMRSDSPAESVSAGNQYDLRLQLGNHVPEDAEDVVQEVQSIDQFRYRLSKN